MRRWLRWLIPATVMAFGMMVIVAGFLYDLAFAGIPYQDPPPELKARFHFHAEVASRIEYLGSALALLGLVALVLLGLWSRIHGPRRAAAPPIRPHE